MKEIRKNDVYSIYFTHKPPESWGELGLPGRWHWLGKDKMQQTEKSSPLSCSGHSNKTKKPRAKTVWSRIYVSLCFVSCLTVFILSDGLVGAVGERTTTFVLCSNFLTLRIFHPQPTYNKAAKKKFPFCCLPSPIQWSSVLFSFIQHLSCKEVINCIPFTALVGECAKGILHRKKVLSLCLSVCVV